MKGTLVILGTDGSIDRRDVESPTNLFRTLQKEVGGYIEMVPYFKSFYDEGEYKPCVAVCNEDGKLTGLPPNQLATAIWHAVLRKDPTLVDLPLAGGQLDSLVGPVVVVMGDEEFMDEL
jgi:hypothetical protein